MWCDGCADEWNNFKHLLLDDGIFKHVLAVIVLNKRFYTFTTPNISDYLIFGGNHMGIICEGWCYWYINCGIGNSWMTIWLDVSPFKMPLK